MKFARLILDSLKHFIYQFDLKLLALRVIFLGHVGNSAGQITTACCNQYSTASAKVLVNLEFIHVQGDQATSTDASNKAQEAS